MASTALFKIAILSANFLIPIALIVFASGFLPYKPVLSGAASFNGSSQPSAIFDKVILMVVDALRRYYQLHAVGAIYHLLIDAAISYTLTTQVSYTLKDSLIQSGAALPFTAHANPPTVTMPRVKAITTGSVPSFSDVILNIAESETMSTLLSQDTLLSQLKKNIGGRLVMYGDDTWLKLFPGMFDRSDGTTSFFVSDFVEVDNNVTRHVSEELRRDDWTAMILHYLGLDHIGHKSGPKSPHMIPKQREMDSIVREIYGEITRQDHLHSTLLILCGDHGMNDAGNHGGSSIGETSPALVFISPKFQLKGIHNDWPVEARSEYQYYHTVEQSDVTPTLAGLLGVPIPINNLGVFIPELLQMWDSRWERLQILLENSKQIFEIAKRTYPEHLFIPQTLQSDCEAIPKSNIQYLACSWSRINELQPGPYMPMLNQTEIEPALLQFLRAAQKIISSTASNYLPTRLYLGSAIAGIAFLISFSAAYQLIRSSGFPGVFLMGSVISYGSLMFASSYVEEEPQFWYWIMTGWVFYLYVKAQARPCLALSRYSNSIETKKSSGSSQISSTRARVLALAILYRIMRRWNQTGQKFAAEPDIAHTFLPRHQNLLWTLVFLSYFDTCLQITMDSPFSDFTLRILWIIMAIIVTTLAFTFKLAFTATDSPELLSNFPILKSLGESLGDFSLILQARLVFVGIAAMITVMYMVMNTSLTKKALHNIFHEELTLFLMTQSRTVNVPLFLILKLQKFILASMPLDELEATVTSLLSQYMSFFAFGGSNSIASIDLSSAYNGVGSYNIFLVGALTFLSNWAGPFWWVSATYLLQSHQNRENKKHQIALLTIHVTASLLSIMTACTVLRTHLFIWTVFSPKFLYSAVWAMGNHLLLNILISGMLSLV